MNQKLRALNIPPSNYLWLRGKLLVMLSHRICLTPPSKVHETPQRAGPVYLASNRPGRDPASKTKPNQTKCSMTEEWQLSLVTNMSMNLYIYECICRTPNLFPVSHKIYMAWFSREKSSVLLSILFWLLESVSQCGSLNTGSIDSKCIYHSLAFVKGNTEKGHCTELPMMMNLRTTHHTVTHAVFIPCSHMLVER